MKYAMLAAIVFATIFNSCKKDNDGGSTPGGNDRQEIRLRDITIPNLPSPWYGLEYDPNGLISKANHSSDQWQYALTYENEKLSHQKRLAPGEQDSISYEYNNGKIDIIRIFNTAGVQYQRCFVDYDSKGRLKTLEWERKTNPGYISERTITLTYHADNNLHVLTDQRFDIPGLQTARVSTDTYTDYDNKKNPDGFTRLHEAHGPLVFFPSIKIQINNPGRVVRSQHYHITYTYIYNAQGLPIERNGLMTMTHGPETGQTNNLKAFFSYY